MKILRLIQSALLALICLILSSPPSASAQGELTPPGPPAPTMKSLSQVEPRTPISSAPITISSPGSYYLVTNLTGSSGANGISISSGSVALDLNGFTLRGVPGSFDGILVTGPYTNVTVRNGSISGWGNPGCDVSQAYNSKVEHLMVSGSIYGIVAGPGSLVVQCLVQSNFFDGIYNYGPGAISGCIAHNNGGAGIRVQFCAVRDCQADGNNGDGITGVSSHFSDCHVRNNGAYGIDAGSSVVDSCFVENNVQSGINGGADCLVTRNNCRFNNSGSNTNDAGILLSGSNNRIEDNHVRVLFNQNGIRTTTNALNNVIVKNSVTSSGGANNYSLSSGNDVGPIGTATNAVSPWANISH
jgi:hypothetical protein